jgi:hypothetical protein
MSDSNPEVVVTTEKEKSLDIFSPEIVDKINSLRSLGLSVGEIMDRLKTENGIDVCRSTVWKKVTQAQRSKISESVANNSALVELAKKEIFSIVDDTRKIGNELWYLYELAKEEGDDEMALKILTELRSWLQPAKNIVYPLVEGVQVNQIKQVDFIELTQRIGRTMDSMKVERENSPIELIRDEPIGEDTERPNIVYSSNSSKSED